MYVVRYQHIRYIVYTELTEATFDFLDRTNDKLVRHRCRFWQQSRMLLRQSQSLLRHCFNCCYFVRVTGQIFQPIWTFNGSNDTFWQPLVTQCLFEVTRVTINIYGGQYPQNSNFRGVNRRFQANHAKYIKTSTMSKLVHRFKPNFVER